MSRRTGTAITLAAALGMAAAVAGLRAHTVERYERVISDEDRYYLPPSSWLRLFSLGYNEALADALWTKAVVYFGGLYQRAPRSERTTTGKRKRFQQRQAAHTARYITAITDLDPRFVRAYVVGSRFVLYHKRELTRETIEAAIDVLERGNEAFPDNGEITFALGFFYYYELPQHIDDEAQRRESRAHGARLLRLASLLEDAPPYASLLGAKALKREGLDELVVEHLRAMLVTATDPKIRASLEMQLERELGKTAEQDILRSRALQRRWRREMPHVSFEFYLLLQSEEPALPAEVGDPLWLIDQPLVLLDEQDSPPSGR